MNIIKNLLDREINSENTLRAMYSEYDKAEYYNQVYCPPIVVSLAKQFSIPVSDMNQIVEKYVYKELAKRYINF
jgi:hypothetical protein